MADLPSKPWDPSADGAHGHIEWPAIPGYQIEARVGAGGMAVVFRARDERLRRPVALKILAGALAADDGFRSPRHPDVLGIAQHGVVYTAA
jgi:serine/threonine protein kinase